MLKKIENIQKDEEIINFPSSWKHKVISKCKQYMHKQGMTVAIVSLIIFSCFLILLEKLNVKNNQTIASASLQETNNKVIMQDLNDINSQLENLATSRANGQKQQALLSKIEINLADARQIMAESAKSKDIDKIATQVNAVKEDIDTHISDMKKAVIEGMGHKEYLEINSLPFKVVSVDIIGSQPYTTVNYANHITPLGISDSLAGWRLVQADYDENIAEFVNTKNQYVKINL